MDQKHCINNRYRVIHPLNQQEPGSFYLVEDLGTPGTHKPRRALKILAETEDQARQMLRENNQRVLAQAMHPHLAQVLDFGIFSSVDLPEYAPENARCFYTREYIEGEDIASYCDKRGLVEICIAFQRIADIMDVLHNTRLIHGQLRTSNIIVSPDGWPHLMDYGLLWAPRNFSGKSAAYLAPEVLQGKKLDEQSDLYALGILLYQVITGHLPFNNADLNELIIWHLKGNPLRVSVESAIPSEVDDIIFRLTHRDPSQRFPSAFDASLALEDAARNLNAMAPTVEKNDVIYATQQVAIQEPQEKIETAITHRLLKHTGGPALLAVEGSEGSGKTALLRYLSHQFQLAGVDVFYTRFCTLDPRPNGPWSSLLSQIAALSHLDSPLEHLDIHRTPFFTICRRIEFFLTRASSNRPLLLLFDDVEQADGENRSVLRFLSQVISPTAQIQLVVAHVPDETLHQVLGRPARMEIRPLTELKIQQLLQNITELKDSSLPGRIFQHTEGKTFRVNFVLSRLHEVKWDTVEDLATLAPQTSNHDIHLTRWHDLGKGEQTLLQLLAVLGRPIRLTLLRRVLQEVGEDMPPMALHASIGRLHQLYWLSGADELPYFFYHGPAARNIYQAIDEDRRRELHIAVAAALADSDEANPLEQAWHFVQAQCPDSALELAPRCFIGAGLKTTLIFVMEQLIKLFEGQSADLSALRLELGELYCNMRCPEEAVQQLQSALQDQAPHELIPAQITLARTLREGGNPRKALQILEAMLLEAQTSLEQITLLVETAKAYAALDLPGETQHIAAKTLLLLDANPDHQDPAAHASIQGLFAWSLGFQGREAEARQHFAAALADTRQNGDTDTEIALLCLQIQWELQSARYLSAATLFERAIALTQQNGDVQQGANLLHQFAILKLHRGQYADSLAHLIDCLRLFNAMEMDEAAAQARCGLGQLELMLGLYEQSLETLSNLLEESRAAGRRLILARALITLAQVQFRRFRQEQARQGIAEGRDILLAEECHEEATSALLDLAQLELLQGNLEQALAALKQAEPEVEKDVSAALKVRFAAYKALTMMRGNNRAEQSLASAILEEALESAIVLDIPSITWECHAIAMELADASGFVNIAMIHAVAGTSILVEMAAGLSEEFMASFWHDSLRRKVRNRAAPEEALNEATPDLLDEGSFHSPLEAALLTEADKAGSMQRLESPPSLAAIEELLDHQRALYRILTLYSHLNWQVVPEKMLMEIMDTLEQLTGASLSSVLLQRDTLQTLISRSTDKSPDAREYNRPIVDFVFRSGHPVITDSTVQDPRFEEQSHNKQSNSVFCIPIRSSGKVIGVLYAESSDDKKRFAGPEQRVLKALADLVAVMLTQTGMAEQ